MVSSFFCILQIFYFDIYSHSRANPKNQNKGITTQQFREQCMVTPDDSNFLKVATILLTIFTSDMQPHFLSFENDSGNKSEKPQLEKLALKMQNTCRYLFLWGSCKRGG
jgi:hypothetical protein